MYYVSVVQKWPYLNALLREPQFPAPPFNSSTIQGRGRFSRFSCSNSSNRSTQNSFKRSTVQKFNDRGELPRFRNCENMISIAVDRIKRREMCRAVIAKLAIDFAPMPNSKNSDKLPPIVYFVNHPVVSNSYAPIVFRACQLMTARRTWVFGKRLYVRNNPLKKRRWK